MSSYLPFFLTCFFLSFFHLKHLYSYLLLFVTYKLLCIVIQYVCCCFSSSLSFFFHSFIYECIFISLCFSFLSSLNLYISPLSVALPIILVSIFQYIIASSYPSLPLFLIAIFLHLSNTFLYSFLLTCINKKCIARLSL